MTSLAHRITFECIVAGEAVRVRLADPDDSEFCVEPGAAERA